MYYFASDVHLGAGDRETAISTERRFVSWLDAVSHDAKEIWLLGDIFDFWYEYRQVVPKGFVRTLGKLAELSDKGVKIIFLTGNHDMWVGDYFAKECGVEILTKPLCVNRAGKKLFIAHGDNLAIKGKPMLKLMNWGFRSRFVRFVFSALFPKNAAVAFGKWWSGRSRKSHGGIYDRSILEPLREYGAELCRRQGLDGCIFGHLHIADDQTIGDSRILFLSDWVDVPTYAVLTDEGELTLKTYEQ